MKVLLILGCVLAAATAINKEFLDKMKEKMHQIGAECAAQEKPSEEDIALLLSNQMPKGHEGKCVISCIYKHFNTINDDGTVNVEGGIQALQPLKENDAELYEKFVTILKKCSSSITLDGDPCNTAVSMVTCSVAEAKEMGLTQEMFDL